MNPLEIVLGVVTLALIIANNFAHKPYVALIDKGQQALSDANAKLAALVDKISGNQAVAAPVAPAAPTVTHTVIVNPGATGVPVPMTPAQLAAVVPIILTPLDALKKTQLTIQNLGYVSYLNALSPADLAAWQSQFVQAANAAFKIDGNGGALLYDPIAKTTLQASNDAAVLLYQLYNLGAKGLITGAPGQ